MTDAEAQQRSSAEPVSFVGGCAEWDRGYGEPAALMSWEAA